MQSKLYNIRYDFYSQSTTSIVESMFKINCLGYFIQKGNYNYEHDFSNQITSLDVSTLDLTNKSLYRYPDLTLPRNKVELLKEKYNVKIVRDLSQADYAVVSNQYLHKLIKYDTGYNLSVVKFKEYLVSHSSDYGLNAHNELTAFANSLNENDIVSFSIARNYSSTERTGQNLSNFIQNNRLDGYAAYYIEDTKSYDEIINANNIVFDSGLISICSEDLHILTEEDFYSLDAMLNNTDQTNITMGLEILSNCNFEKSLDIAAMLYYFNYDNLKNGKNWNNINVKTLKKRFAAFSVSAYNHNGSYYERCLTNLIAENYLTEFAFKTIAAKSFNNVIVKVMNLNQKDSVFKIDVEEIQLNDKYKNSIKKNDEGVDVLNIKNTHYESFDFNF